MLNRREAIKGFASTITIMAGCDAKDACGQEVVTLPFADGGSLLVTTQVGLDALQELDGIVRDFLEKRPGLVTIYKQTE